MKAVGYTQHGLPTDDPRSLVDLDLPEPEAPRGRDLLVRVHAVSVNPRDIKSRATVAATAGTPVVLGYDASGIIKAVGPDATLFRPGDAVF